MKWTIFASTTVVAHRKYTASLKWWESSTRLHIPSSCSSNLTSQEIKRVTLWFFQDIESDRVLIDPSVNDTVAIARYPNNTMLSYPFDEDMAGTVLDNTPWVYNRDLPDDYDRWFEVKLNSSLFNKNISVFLSSSYHVYRSIGGSWTLVVRRISLWRGTHFHF